METLCAFVEPVVKYIIKPIGHQLGYLFWYKRNIKDLEKQLKNLQHTRERVHSLVDEKRSYSYEIYNDVLEWLAEVDGELQPSEGSSPSLFNCVQRHQIARKTKKRVESILKLIEDGKKFQKDNVGRLVPLPSTKSPSLPEDYQIIKSRTLLAEKIKDALSNPNVNKVGACGMGGVGKTKLLDEVKKLILENNLFDRVIKVEIGQSKSVFKIQEEIGGQLNMELNMQCDEVRSSCLQTHIVEKKENILFMLDDLWEEYDVENEIGIPCGSRSRIEGCKILMTGRDQTLFKNQMNTDRLFEVNVLSDEESWKFFMTIIGEFNEDGNMQQIAKDVVKECGGLPIALKILAKTLKGKRVEIWKNAFKSLKNPTVVNIPNVSDKLYSCLQFSYNSIEEEAKLLLLLCSVFPDDHKIYVGHLQMYAMGMRLLNDINTWKDARNRVIKLVDDLKSSYLLLQLDERDDFVQMHDVVHDFAKYIASMIGKMKSLTYGSGQREWQEDHRHGTYNAIYVDCTTFLNLPPKLEFPNLQLLILNNNHFRRTNAIQISDTLFEGMEDLRIFYVDSIDFTPSSWTSLTHSLNNLQTLFLSCRTCIDIDTIGELKKLEILTIICPIEELPVSMSELTQLKVLHLCCNDLKVIHPNIIPKMIRLEELNLWDIGFTGWGEEVWYKNKLITNAKLSELNCLTHLFHLKLRVPSVEILSNELSLEIAQNLEEFSVHVVDLKSRVVGSRTLGLAIDSPIDSIDGVLQILLLKCEGLAIEDSVGFTSFLCNTYAYPHLKNIVIYIDEDEGIGNTTPHFDLQVAFPELKELAIKGGDNYFDTLWHNNNWLTENSFCKLQEIYIGDCKKLTYVFPSCMIRSLVFLNTLEVCNCEFVERIFEIEESTNNYVNQVVPLTSLCLLFLPNLKHVWNNDPACGLLTFPNLQEVNVEQCPKLKTLFPASFINHMKEIERLYFDGGNEIFGDSDEASQFVSSEIVLFPNLRELTIHCKLVEKRKFWLPFPKLQTLRLIGFVDDGMVSLPLEMSELVQISCFESLEDIEVKGCGNLMCLLPSSSITFFNLISLSVDESCNRMMDLFSSSVAKTMVNLQRMSIRRCKEMKYIVVAPNGEDENGEEEIIFNRLNDLELYNLPRLTSFHSGKCMLTFPCLESLKIFKCLEMKTFSYGIISMPKLSHVKLEEHSVSISPPHGLNVIIQDSRNDEIVRSIKNLFTQYQDEKDREEYY